MFDLTDRIFKTANSESYHYGGSLGQLINEKYQELTKGDQTQIINGETGEVITASSLLKSLHNVFAGFKAINLKDDAVVTLIGSYGSNQIPLVLGTVFYGACMFPVDPNLKTLEYEHFLTVQTPDVVFVEKRALDQALQAVRNVKLSCPVFVVDSKERINECQSFNDFIQDTTNTEFSPKSDFDPATRRAFIMPSSGTTGKPKGVALSQSHVINAISSFQNDMNFEEKRITYLSITQLFWVSGLLTLFVHLLQRTTLVYIRTVTPEVILSVIQKYKPNSTIFFPAMLNLVLTHPDFSKFDVSSIKYIFVGGSSLPMAFVEVMKKKWKNLKDISFFQVYGATEIAGMVTTSRLNGIPAPIESVGYLKDGFHLKVVDSNGKPLLPNQEGEILLRKKSTRTYYVNNDQANTDAYDADDFYKTGDLGYITESGLMYITGRTKEIIKSRGYQVSPLEIENVILKMTGVNDVAVIGIPDVTDGCLISAVVVKNPESTITQNDIINEVAEKLSETNHIRGGVQFVTKIPYNTNGKKLRNQVIKLLPTLA